MDLQNQVDSFVPWPWAQQASRLDRPAPVRVFSVKSGSIRFARSRPPIILLSGEGHASTSGWTNPTLGAWFYVVPPKDGIQDVDFVAEPPVGPVLTVLTSISASVAIGPVDPQDYWGPGQPLVGFRIHSATNSVEVRLAE